MKTYKVVRDCYGFQKRMWKEGEIVRVDDNEVVPRHFQLIDGDVKPPVKEEKPSDQVALSQVHNKPKVNSGFAYQAPDAQATVPQTAGSEQKEESQKKPEKQEDQQQANRPGDASPAKGKTGKKAGKGKGSSSKK